jgi:sugar lactone lactonase YvrE
MKGRRFVNLGAAALALTIAAGGGAVLFSQNVAAQGRGGQAPRLDVDPLWPKPFPVDKHWALGSVTGVAVDAQDHIWVANRGVASLQNNEKGPTLTPWASECCFGAPQVLEFDAAGTLLNSWGGPGQGYQWPQNPAGITVDGKGNVWIAGGGYPAAPAGRGRGPAPAAAAAPAAGAAGAGAGRGAGRGAGAAGGAAPAAAGGAAPAAAAQAGRGAPAAPAGPADAHVIKFDRTGKPLLTIGTPGKMDGAESHDTLNAPQGVAVDDAANEVYVADSGNKRIVVFDANTGAYKRHWTAAGSKPFADVSCVRLAKDGNVYACDSANNRIVAFEKNGKFVKEGVVKDGTGGFVLGGAGGAQGTVYSFGSVWDIAFSNDAQQRYLYVADGMNKTVWIVQRDTLAPVSRFGEGGRNAGRFYAVGSVAVDSKGNVYTGEDSDGKRVQKWINKGMGPAQLN